VQVAVVTDLVTGIDDRPDRVGMPVGREARHEERRSDAASLEDAQEPRETRAWAVGLMRHHTETRRGLGDVAEDAALGVDVERDHHGGTVPARPLVGLAQKPRHQPPLTFRTAPLIQSPLARTR
jgi:hypothetical protein